MQELLSCVILQCVTQTDRHHTNIALNYISHQGKYMQIKQRELMSLRAKLDFLMYMTISNILGLRNRNF